LVAPKLVEVELASVVLPVTLSEVKNAEAAERMIAKKLVLVLLVDDALVAKKLVLVLLLKKALVEK
jgi:hypothetical protein